MSTEPSGQIADMQGELALPRSNGELVFAAPWEGRAFGIAVALNEGGAYEWGEFQGRLAEEIASAPRDEDASLYYERWLASLERLLLDQGMVTREDLDARTAAYESGELDEG
ncbi:hypothetical protein GBAR_LOCUS29432 [Geodia barretti]|jgi:nitrile hydratase accessory protein|uniref:Nitrile hydratase beta subunit-like N-terminal domain-containing protein n=1 Tax=Geodia barretti TaxID=519541 RepID=A0AA35TUA2_GEOBA|nr:hypothetical protein GBAR_LOCUS29432 [Geodia barretti]